MAARKTKENTETKVKEKRKRFSFFSDMSSDAKLRLLKFSGLALGFFTLCTFVFIVSYLFTWTSDQSLISQARLLPLYQE